MIIKSVSVSGSVGKQVYYVPSAGTVSGATKVNLHGFLLNAPAADSDVVIREGHASGTVIFEGAALASTSLPVQLPQALRVDKGLHVKVTGSNAVCYLYVN